MDLKLFNIICLIPYKLEHTFLVKNETTPCIVN